MVSAEKTFLIKMAISGDNERELMRFISCAIDNDRQSLSFNNFSHPLPEEIMFQLNPTMYVINWRLENWGVVHDCFGVVKNVQSTGVLFNDYIDQRHVEYLQFTTLFNLPVKLWVDISALFSVLTFNFVFISSTLDQCGRMILKSGEILDQVIRTDPETDRNDFLLFAKYLYDI